MVVGVRRPMPRRRSGHTTTVTIGAERFCLTANRRDDGSLGEVFIHWGKHGTSAAGLVSTYAVALSLGLQHQVPLADLIRPGLDQFFVPNGHTDDPEIPRVRSAVDYIARRLAIDWLPYPERALLGVYTLTERVHRASTWIEAHEPSQAGRLRSGRLPVPHPDVRYISPAGLARRARQQPGDHDLEEFADGRCEVQAHGGQRRVGRVGRQHRSRWLRVRPQRPGHHGDGAGQLEGVVLAEFGHAPAVGRGRASHPYRPARQRWPSVNS